MHLCNDNDFHIGDNDNNFHINSFNQPIPVNCEKGWICDTDNIDSDNNMQGIEFTVSSLSQKYKRKYVALVSMWKEKSKKFFQKNEREKETKEI